MFAKVWNAAVALIEGRTDVAAGMLREADLPYNEHGAVQQRLIQSVQNAQRRSACERMREVLMMSLNLHAGDRAGVAREAYYQGVRDVESLLENMLLSLEWKSQPDEPSYDRD